MNKRITRKFFAAFAVGLFFVGGAFAQTHQNAILKSNEYSGDSAVTVQITTGKTLPVYVRPDSYYHPNWNAHNSTLAVDAELTDGFTWNFSFAGSNISTANQADNYIEVTATGAVGSTATLLVTETAPDAYGGCTGGTAAGIEFEVVAIPTVTAPATTYYKFCDGTAGPANITATLNGVSDFNLIWDVFIYNTTTADTLRANATETYTSALAAAGNTTTYHTQMTAASPEAVASSGAFNLMTEGDAIIAQGDFVVRGGARTVYEFVVRDVNDLVSRKSDFLSLTGTVAGSITDDQYVYYDVAGGTAGTTNHTVQVVVLPAPVTGPIYHIPANWAQ